MRWEQGQGRRGAREGRYGLRSVRGAGGIMPGDGETREGPRIDVWDTTDAEEVDQVRTELEANPALVH